MPTVYMFGKKEKPIIYVAEIVFSVLKEDGKRKIDTIVKAFANFEDARAYVDSAFESSNDIKRVKSGKVWEIEKFYENVEKVL